jgi:hypothetical protein
MRRGLPSLIIVGVTIGVGLVVLAHQFIVNPILDSVGGTLVEWASIVAAFAVLLGLFNVFGVHLQRIVRREGNGWSSAVILVTALLVLLLVLPSGGASPQSAWIFQYLYQPLEASFLALLVFFIATAAFRALRARTWETALLVVAALIVLIGSAPAASLIAPQLVDLKDWVMNVPTVAGVRGILLGVALGIMGTGLRLITGIDRPYSE